MAGGLLPALEHATEKGQLPEGTVEVRQVEIRFPAASTCTLAVALGQSRCSSPVGQEPREAETLCSARHETSHVSPPPLPVSRRSSPGLATCEDTWGPSVRKCWGWDLNPGPQTDLPPMPVQRAAFFTICHPPASSTCHTYTHDCTYMCTVPAHTQVHAHTQACVYTQGHTQVCAHTGTHISTCAHRRVHAHRCTHTQVHVHT